MTKKEKRSLVWSIFEHLFAPALVGIVVLAVGHCWFVGQLDGLRTEFRQEIGQQIDTLISSRKTTVQSRVDSSANIQRAEGFKGKGVQAGSVGRDAVAGDKVDGNKIVNKLKTNLREDPTEIDFITNKINQGMIISKKAVSLCKDPNKDVKFENLRSEFKQWFKSTATELQKRISRKAMLLFIKSPTPTGMAMHGCNPKISKLHFTVDHYVRNLQEILKDL